MFELVLIAAFALSATSAYLNFDPQWTLTGLEAQWLTGSAQFTAESLQTYGYLPLWQPYFSRGEPSIDNPVTFVLNPVETVPSIIFGYPNGIKISVVVAAMVVGWGGWYLGRVLGFGLAGRVLLGLLFVVKGPQHASISLGFFQLGITQSFLPWVLASAVGVVKFPQQRYPLVLLAFWLAQVFLGGNIYFTLPALLMAVSIIGAYIPRSRTASDPPHWFPYTLDRAMSWRLIISLALTAGFAAITLLPLILNSGYIGRHFPETGWGTYADPVQVLAQLFTPNLIIASVGVRFENYYIYSMPLWFAFIVFVLLPVIERSFPGERKLFGPQWRIWAMGIFLLIFFTTWGTGTNALVGWLREVSPFIARWRGVNRMLTMTSFWVAIFTALAIDQTWKRIDPEAYFQRLSTADLRVWARAAARVGLGLGIVFVILIAMWETLSSRAVFGTLEPESQLTTDCLAWMRANDRDDPFTSVWTLDYNAAASFLKNGVRMSNLTADYDPLGVAPTLYNGDLTQVMPEWALPGDDGQRQMLSEQGWSPAVGSPPIYADIPCAWHNPNALSYVFTIPYETLISTPPQLPPEDIRFPTITPLTQPVRDYTWLPGHITIPIDNPTDEPLVLVVQDVAWPGWVVRLDGQPAQIESVGQLIGVVVPPNSTPTVEFEFTAPLLRVGAIITGLTGLFALLYLLRADRWRIAPRISLNQPRTQTGR